MYTFEQRVRGMKCTTHMKGADRELDSGVQGLENLTCKPTFLGPILYKRALNYRSYVFLILHNNNLWGIYGKSFVLTMCIPLYPPYKPNLKLLNLKIPPSFLNALMFRITKYMQVD